MGRVAVHAIDFAVNDGENIHHIDLKIERTARHHLLSGVADAPFFVSSCSFLNETNQFQYVKQICSI